MRNAVSNKGEPRKILGGKNLTVARACTDIFQSGQFT